ncbi:unnamed protein product [Paramecium pentaurelia]|uniref:RING-type domain-containing protein n=1 Tax=Paramecium pentaurelia TaxID=43138 RepID=A0A8S1V2T8_9CILI|nr:unnamed protein product [Paramecium pentaurelia]
MLFLFIFTLLIKAQAIDNLTINQEYQETGTIFKLIDSQYQVIQSVQNTTFYFQPFQIDQDKYITVELIFGYPQDGDVNIEFSITKNKKDNTSSKNDVFYDINGQFLKKAYQMIQINPFTFNNNDKYYIDILIRDTHFTDYQYIIKITKTNNKKCPNDCGNQQSGLCYTENGICACSSQYVDLDCSRLATPLSLKQPLKNIAIQKKDYFYFERDSLIPNITLNLGLMNSQYHVSDVQAYIMYENFECGLANEGYFNYYISFHDQSSQSVQIDLSPLIYDQYIERYQRLLITVTTQTPALIYISLSLSSTDGNLEMDQSLVIVYVLVSIAIMLLVAWIIIILIRYRRSSRVQDETNTISNSQINNNNNINNRRNKSILNTNLLDQYMPKLQYSQILEIPEIQEQDVQEACSVCLIEYQKYCICRLTPCHHIFHPDCLQQWILKHENCPLCRTPLDQKSLKELIDKNANQTFKFYQTTNKQTNQNAILQSQLFSNAQTELRIIAHNSIDNQ